MLLCGHYEGVDERVMNIIDDEILDWRLCTDRRRTARHGAR